MIETQERSKRCTCGFVAAEAGRIYSSIFHTEGDWAYQNLVKPDDIEETRKCKCGLNDDEVKTAAYALFASSIPEREEDHWAYGLSGEEQERRLDELFPIEVAVQTLKEIRNRKESEKDNS